MVLPDLLVLRKSPVVRFLMVAILTALSLGALWFPSEAHAANFSFVAETSTTDNATICGDTKTNTQSPTASTVGNKISVYVDIQAPTTCSNVARGNTVGQYEETSGFKSNQVEVSNMGTYSVNATWYLSWQGETSDGSCQFFDPYLVLPGRSAVTLSIVLRIWDLTTNTNVSDSSTIIWSSLAVCDDTHIDQGSGPYAVSASYDLQPGRPYQFETYADALTQTGALGYANSLAELDSSSYLQSLSVSRARPLITGLSFPSSIALGESATIALTAKNAGTGEASEGDVQIAFPQNPDSSVILSMSSDTDLQPPSLNLPGGVFNGCNYGGPGCSVRYPSVAAIQGLWTIGGQKQLTVTVKPQQAGTFVFEVKVTMAVDYGSWLGNPVQSCSSPKCSIDQQGEMVLQESINVRSAEEHIQITKSSCLCTITEGDKWSIAIVASNFDAGLTGAQTFLIYRFPDQSGNMASIREPLNGTVRIDRSYLGDPPSYAFPAVSAPNGLPVGNYTVYVELWWDDFGTQNLQDLISAQINVQPLGHIVVNDTTPPVTTPQTQGVSGLNGWYTSNSTVALNATDDSAVSVTLYSLDNQTWYRYTSPFALSEGRNMVFYRSLDNASNLESIGSISVPIDTTPPTIIGSMAPIPNAYGWNNGDVRVHFDCADNLSGMASCTTDVVRSNEGRNQSVTGTAEDLAGNSAITTIGGISIDKTSPYSTGCTVNPPAKQDGWYNTDVTVECAFMDDLSGIHDDIVCVQAIGVVCPGPIVHTTIGTEGRDQSVTLCTFDRAGNKGCTIVGGINIDKTPPVLASPQDGQAFILRQTVLANAACADSLSGIDTCVAPDLVDTSTVGAHSYIVTSADLAGNRAALTVRYNVQYAFMPVSPKPPSLRLSVGSTIPVRFQLKDALGNLVSTAAAQIWVDSPTNPGKCSGSSNAGNYFRYDSTNNQYMFNLSTKGMTIGQHTIFVALDDGTTQVVTVTLSSG